MFVTKAVSNDDISRVVKLDISLNILCISVTFEVLKLDKSNDARFEEENILFIVVALDVLKLEISKVDKLVVF